MKAIIEATETERKRIAKDLHDSVGALMATSKLSIENLLMKLFSRINLKIVPKSPTVSDRVHTKNPKIISLTFP